MHLMQQGRSVFLTGPAGSGKTFVVNKFISGLKKQKKGVGITASTGIAATHLNGTTIHSWSGLGIREELTKRDLTRLANNARLNKRYNSTDVLIIDEVSMLHGRRLNMINQACKLLRQSDEPFGGLQLILTGDLFQLPPVNRSGEPDDFVHLSAAWQELNPAICYLSEQHRQKDGELLDVLEAMRASDLRRRHLTYLQGRMNLQPAPEVVLTRLYSHNVDVEQVNQARLDQLPGKSQTYKMESTGRKSASEQLQKSVLAPLLLELKLGAEIMFVANNFARHFANGTRACVIEFDQLTGLPIVQLQNSKRKILVEPHTWNREEDGKIRASVSQLPLRLAWAITIHKSQGMSLDSALIDLSQSFTYGMGYVALSRVRSLDGLYLSGLNSMALKLHPGIFATDQSMRALSSELAVEIGEVVLEKVAEAPKEFDGELFEKLRAWRAKRANKEKLAAYIIAHDKTLHEIARHVPKNKQELLRVNGFGPKKLEQYGDDILRITSA